jgi:hypothetical protein
MSEPGAGPQVFRSVLAVLAGVVALSIASFAIEAVVNALLAPSLPLRLFTMAYTLACVAGGGYLAAWIARRAPVQHALAVGVLMAIMTIDVWISGMSPEQPVWLWIAGVALLIPAAWWGGAIHSKLGRT